MTGKGRRLGRDDWTAAALAAIAEGGIAAVAVEPLAARLGATKGSAYWHFANREELLRATVERWERESTEMVIELVETAPPGVDRLRRLFTTVFDRTFGADTAIRIQLALLAAGTDPVVAPVLRRVTERRVGYLTELFTGLGFRKTEARHRAVFTYSSYLGNVQLLRDLPAMLPAAERRHYLDRALAILTARGDEP